MNAAISNEAICEGFSRVASRHPELKSMIDAEALAQSLDGLLQTLENLILKPRYSLTVGSCFRPILLRVVSSAVAKRLAHDSLPEDNVANATTSISLSILLELAPQLEDVVLLYFMHAPPPFAGWTKETSSNVADPAVPALEEVLGATLRLLQLAPSLKHRWDCTPLLSFITNESPLLRWCTVQLAARWFGMCDSAARQLGQQVLSAEEEMDCAMRWDDDCMRQCYCNEDLQGWPAVQSVLLQRGPSGMAGFAGLTRERHSPDIYNWASFPRGVPAGTFIIAGIVELVIPCEVAS
ncbi:hypothetical protein CYMTET_14456 [Cymbomonas tetramitiformis]|uniref:Uncharacterized protein n=1 Tax=Cymbomonas tetramitiformis TaxID=36881 RepID=A0AAE0L9W8_9CHLO|nr:hypothetical protein CYMTET_14456 [Cymbomonas tetramitiformis]